MHQLLHPENLKPVRSPYKIFWVTTSIWHVDIHFETRLGCRGCCWCKTTWDKVCENYWMHTNFLRKQYVLVGREFTIPLWTEYDNCRCKSVTAVMPLQYRDSWLVVRGNSWHHACTPSPEVAANSSKYILRLPHPQGGRNTTLSNQNSAATIVVL